MSRKEWKRMLKKNNNDDLMAKDIAEKYYLLFQVWKELTERKTLDSYQYRIMNSLEALCELNNVIDYRLSRYHNTNHNIDECKEETMEIISCDKVMKKHYYNLWQQLLNHLSEKTDTDAKQKALKYQIEYTYNILREKYFNHLIDDLEDDINHSNNADIIVKTNMLISNCVSRGWSTLALHNVIDNLYESKTDSTKWEGFKERLLASADETYHVYIPLKLTLKNTGSQSKEVAWEWIYGEISDMGIQVKKKEDLLIENTFFSDDVLRYTHYILVSVSAYDYYSATYKAIDKCSDILNMLSFYNYIEAWHVKKIRCLAVNSQKNTFREVKEKELYETYDYIESSKKIYHASKIMYSQKNTTIHKRLQDVYAYSNMAKAASSQEEKFMNKWIALESLCRSDVYENIIRNILETVPAALCARYIYQHFRNFIEDCSRCGVNLTFSTIKIDVSPSRDKIEVVKQIVEVFNDVTLYPELQMKCAVNDLLVERCNMLHKLATDKKELYKKIEKHNFTVRKQLSRLYRIRNNIAHNAMTSAGTLMLYIEHLDNYLTGVVAEIVMCAERKQEGNIEIVFEIIKDNYDTFNAIVRDKKATDEVLLEKLLKTGIIDLI